MWIIWIALASMVLQSATCCPEQCRCSLDEKGRRKVQCEEGGMKDPIPVLKMAYDTEVLFITAHKERTNKLTLGPIFRGLRKLEEIHITWSNIPALGDHTFWGLKRLHVLNLTHNNIESLRDTNFRGVDSLRRLDLSHNRIESVPSTVFRSVQHLKSLTLAHNRLPDLAPRIFFGLSHLERLDLSYNPLGDLLPDRFTDVPDLRIMSCAGCGLMVISTTLLEKLPKLHYLDLKNNRLTQIPHHINIMKNLIYLHLDGNHISFVERNILSDSSLKKIFLSKNRIIRIEEGAFANTSLTHLDLSYNRLSHLEPGSLDDVLEQLVDFRISGNSLYIDELKSILPKAKNLRHLGLGDMGLSLLPTDLLKHSRHLHHLNISANYLQRIPLAILRSTPHLRVLDLSSNSFKGTDINFIQYLTESKYLRVLKLEGNPWHCDKCHVGEMLKWLQAAPDQESGCIDSRVWTCLKCVGPKGLSGTSLSLLPKGDLPQCTLSTPSRPTYVGPTLSGAVIENPKRVSHPDQPRLPHGPLTLQEQEWSWDKIFEEQLILVITVICIFTLVLLIIIIAAIVAYNRHSAYYYTNEDDPEKREKLVKLREAKSNFPSQKNNSKEEKKDATIATIDELTNIAGSTEILETKPDNIPELETEPKPGIM